MRRPKGREVKTITEFSGFLLSDAIKKLFELTPRPPRPEKKNDRGRHGGKFKGKGKFQKEDKKDEATTSTESVATVDQTTEVVAQPTEAIVETVAQTAEAPVQTTEVAEQITEANAQATETSAPTGDVSATADATAQAATPAPAVDIPKVMGETFKLEGEKLEMFMVALELVKRQWHHLKRVIVMQPAAEGEKAPQGAVEKNGKFYLVEHFFVPKPKFDPRNKGRGGFAGKSGKGRFGGKGGKGKGGGRFGNKPNRGGRPGEVRADGVASGEGAIRDPGLGPDGKPWRSKKPRGPRKPFTTIGPNGELLGRDGTPFRPRQPKNGRDNNRFQPRNNYQQNSASQANSVTTPAAPAQTSGATESRTEEKQSS